jgi:uncharacterized membrane protein YidH (DUF202 family)
MNQTLLGLIAITVFGFVVSIISIRRYFLARKMEKRNSLKKKIILTSIVGMVISVPVTITFIILIIYAFINLS